MSCCSGCGDLSIRIIVDGDSSVCGVDPNRLTTGIINFTIGQRKGIKISSKDPLYVIRLDAKRNEVIVGKKNLLVINKIYLKDVNILGDFQNKDDLFIKV